ncbi:PREDICTED: alpha-2,8-sialyltransferase 8F [Crocodylus porosus]|uniref:ST8 alpha-N-acetyl-neuraminide alpha-2,8-sialyltransferase 6 n=1 Tax=Crocodylus porosus TaxID=8502 RepID=A0A7M4EXP6_CROPO|nr:PREDICTED: alpha-2,8-sialyltransferase 8F [Crocodylus porosus]XP_019388046.1 PREDICTED: alpha-2,8-sialyltransferase 8F [Crocodylus porosus]
MRAVIALVALLGSLLLFVCLLWLTTDGSLRARSWEKEATAGTPQARRKLRSPLASVQPGPRSRNRTAHNKNGIYSHDPALQCKEIQDNVLSSSIKKKRYSENYYLQIVTKLQHCAWKRRPEEYEKFRSELTSCCDAAHNFIASQNNTPLGSNLSYEVDHKKVIHITKDIFRMLPASPPFLSYPFKHCAVVGNGGILKNSSCGTEIDNSDFVFRCNLPPTTGSISKDVGNKTNLVTVNPSIIAQKYKKLKTKTMTFLQNIAVYGNAFLLLPAFSFRSNTAASFKVYHTLHEFGAKQRAIFFHPRYLKSLARFWRTKGVKAYRLSSGFMITSAAVELCENVKLYGFWPFSKNIEQVPISHHYYDNQLPKPGFHAMPKEYNQILKLHGKGILKLQFGQCE